MRRPDISGEALPSPGRNTGTATRGRITGLTAVMGIALLSQCGHAPGRKATEAPRQRQSAADSLSVVPPEVLEAKRRELFVRIKSCAGSCTTSEAMTLATACGEKPLTAHALCNAAALLDPSRRASVHAIAEILATHPELAPDVLTCLHEFLGELPMTDPRKLAGMLIPCHDDSLEDAMNVKITARRFLLLEEASGSYTPAPRETLTADANVRTILTRISNSVEK